MATTLRSGWIGRLAQALAVVCLCVGVGVFGRSAAGQGTDWIGSPTHDYPTVGGNYANHRYSTLDQINTTNISKLGGAWSIHLEERRPDRQSRRHAHRHRRRDVRHDGRATTCSRSTRRPARSSGDIAPDRTRDPAPTKASPSATARCSSPVATTCSSRSISRPGRWSGSGS